MEEKISGRKPNYGFLSRVLYGMGEFFGGGCFVIINSFFAVFLTKALGMPPALAGTIPMVGKINSLNASAAGAVLMYEIFLQRKLT